MSFIKSNIEKKKSLILKAYIRPSFLDDERALKHNLETVAKILSDFGSQFSSENKIVLENYIKDTPNILQKEKHNYKEIKDIQPILDAVLKTAAENISKKKNILNNSENTNQIEFTKAKKMARLSIVFGILSLVLSVLGLVPGLIFGYKALAVLKKHNIKNEIKIAKIGILINYGYVALIALLFILFKTTDLMK